LFSAFSILGEYNSNGQLPYRYRRMLGYDHLIRGYENYVVDGTRGFLVNAALRYRFINKTYPLEFVPFESYSFLPVQAFLEFFVDAGGAYNDVPDRSNNFQNSMLYSTGFSLQTLFYNDRVVRFEYSLNAARESGFYIHFEKAI
jgi:hemolysin activation/secretion protein